MNNSPLFSEFISGTVYIFSWKVTFIIIPYIDTKKKNNNILWQIYSRTAKIAESRLYTFYCLKQFKFET